MIISAPKKIFPTRRYLLFCALVISIILELVISLWFIIPPFKRKILSEYYKLRYPLIPASEFFGGTKYNTSQSGDRTTIGTYRGKLIETVGVSTTITNMGKTFSVVSGRVSVLPKIFWDVELGSSESANIPNTGRAVDMKLRKVGIVLNNASEIITVPPETIIQKPLWRIVNGKVVGDLRQFSHVSFNDIKVGDFIVYQDGEPPTVFITPGS